LVLQTSRPTPTPTRKAQRWWANQQGFCQDRTATPARIAVCMMEDALTCATSLSVKDGASSMSVALVTAGAVRARLRVGAAVRRGAAIASHKPPWPRGVTRQRCVQTPVVVTVYAPIDVDPLISFTHSFKRSCTVHTSHVVGQATLRSLRASETASVSDFGHGCFWPVVLAWASEGLRHIPVSAYTIR